MWKLPSTSLPILLSIVAMSAKLIVPTTSSDLTLVPEEREASCPACEMFFTRLEVPLSSEGVNSSSQDVELRVRGEPKSGTGFVFEWGVGALIHACEYLRHFFGEESCTTELEMSRHETLRDVLTCSFIFEPGQHVQDARCPCPEVERVRIYVQSKEKHMFPVEMNCSWAHPGSFAVTAKHVCSFADGSKPQNYEEIRDCMEENQCPISASNIHQLALFRDPRAVAVSTYYFKHVYERLHTNGDPIMTVDAFALRILPVLCQWIGVRHILFGEYLAEQSTIFWFEDIKADPVEYHRAWLALAGLHLPVRELEIAVETALSGELSFHTKGLDPHPGSPSDHAQNRTFRNELKNVTLSKMERILRQWLPPVFLSKLGVPR